MPRLAVEKARQTCFSALHAAHSRDAQAGALREPRALVGQQRGVGRDDDDDRPSARDTRGRRSFVLAASSKGTECDLLWRDRHGHEAVVKDEADWRPVDLVLAAPVVGLHERADRVAAVRTRRAGAMPCRCRP